MNALLYILKRLYGYYEMFREKWPDFSAWLIVAPMMVLLAWFVLSFPIYAIVGALIWAAELRYNKAI